MAIVAPKVYPFKDDLHRYLKFDEIAGFEDCGRVIPVGQMPKLDTVEVLV